MTKTKHMSLKDYCKNSPYGYSIHDIIYNIVGYEELLNGMGYPYMTLQDTKRINKIIRSTKPPVKKNYNKPLDPAIQEFNRQYTKTYKKPLSTFTLRSLITI